MPTHDDLWDSQAVPEPRGLRSAMTAVRAVGALDPGFCAAYRQRAATAIVVARLGGSNGIESRRDKAYRLAAQPFPLVYEQAVLSIDQIEAMNALVEAQVEQCRSMHVRITSFGMQNGATEPYLITYLAQGDLPHEVRSALTPFGADTVRFIERDVRGARA